jgi:multidrug transporter EmrE-like cation transporter
MERLPAASCGAIEIAAAMDALPLDVAFQIWGACAAYIASFFSCFFFLHT